jgi:hypothetical protein
MNWEYYPEEIAQILCESTYDDCNKDDPRYIAAEEILYEIKNIAENKYNKIYWRVFYQLLQDFADINQGLLK